jgi:hypothetical protein
MHSILNFLLILSVSMAYLHTFTHGSMGLRLVYMHAWTLNPYLSTYIYIYVYDIIFIISPGAWSRFLVRKQENQL